VIPPGIACDEKRQNRRRDSGGEVATPALGVPFRIGWVGILVIRVEVPDTFERRVLG
jgi:hypothetical protein